MIRPDRWPWEVSAESHGVRPDPVAHHPYHPVPDPVTGALVVDPDIVLPARGFNVEISLYYNSASTGTMATWGKKRSASVAMQLKTGTNEVWLIRGDGSVYHFTGSWTSPATLTPDASMFSGTQLDWDGTQFIETFGDGKTVTYAQALSGSYFAVSAIADPSGNIHTYTYNTGKLETIAVPGGNKVSFLYNGNQVETIQDWGGRRWTMTYDVDTQLTDFTIPTGCQTQYHQAGSTGLIDAITDPRGYTTSYTYESSSKRIETMSRGTATWTYTYSGTYGTKGGSQVMSPSGAITTFLLDANVRLDTKLMPEGYTVTYGYDSNNLIIQEDMPYGTVKNVTLNAFNQPLTSTDALGNVTTFNYDVSNNLVRLQNALGEVTTMAYDGQRRMTSRMDALGRTQSWEYNTNGTLKASVDGRGLRTTHSYDAIGNLASTMYSDSGVVTYGYDNLSRRITTMDQLGRVTTTAYDAADHVVSMMNAAGEVSTFIYDTCLLQATVDPLGHRTSYTYERYGKQRTVMNALGQVTTTNYDNMGYPVSMQNALGHVTTIVYNAARQRLAVQDANGNYVTTSYDLGGRPVSMINGEGIVTTTIYDARGPIASQDALGRRTTMIQDALGRTIAVESPMGFRTSTIYDKAGQVKATQDALGYLTTNAYDAAGNMVTTMDARGHVSTSIYETNSNRLLANQEATGARTSYSYDFAGQTTRIMDARSNATTVSYDLAGRTKSVQNALGYRTTYGYDAAGRQVAMQNARGYTFTTVYDEVNRAIARQTPLNIRTTQVYDAAGQLVASIDGEGFSWTTIYDPAGRPIASQTPLNHRTTTTYDKANRPVEVRNPRGYINTTTYDLASQVVGQTNPLGHQKQFGYDANGRNVTIANAIGGIITMVYDARGSMTAIANELNQRTTYSFDPTGNTNTRQFANADVTTYSYDPIGREASRFYADATRVTIAYDPVGNRVTVESALGVSTSGFDGANQCIGTTDELGVDFSQGYDPTGNRTELFTGSVGNQLMYWEYDADGRVSSTKDVRKNEVVTQYDRRSLKTTLTYEGGRVQVYGYDASSRNTLITDDVSGQVQRFTYTFDGNGNRINTLDLNGSNSTYTYDAADRLTGDTTSGTNAHTFGYSWDSRGNILTNSESGVINTFTYDAASRLTTSIAGADITTYTFDSNGNLTQADQSGSQFDMAYDKENRLVQHVDVSAGGYQTDFTYDPYSHKKTENDNGSYTNELYWLDDMYIGQGESGVMTKSFTNNGGYFVGEVEDVQGQQNTNYYLVDYLGSITGETDINNGVWNDRRFTPFLRRLSGAYVDTFSPGYAGAYNYRYAAVAFAEFYMWHRHFAEATSQWTTRDLLWPNELAYGYVSGAAPNIIDPMGLAGVRPYDKALKICNCARTGPPWLRPGAIPRPDRFPTITPDAGVPIPRPGPSLRTCLEEACQVFCKSHKGVLDAEKNYCGDPYSPIDAAVGNSLLPPCPPTNNYRPLCAHWCEKSELWGSGCAESNDPPQREGGRFCQQECHARACCWARRREDEIALEALKAIKWCRRIFSYV